MKKCAYTGLAVDLAKNPTEHITILGGRRKDSIKEKLEKGYYSMMHVDLNEYELPSEQKYGIPEFPSFVKYGDSYSPTAISRRVKKQHSSKEYTNKKYAK